MSHTPEPWKVIAPIRGYAAGISTDTPGETPHREITISNLPEFQGHGDPHANATRIVACVNGCAGLNPAAYRACVEALKRVLYVHGQLNTTNADDSVAFITFQDAARLAQSALTLAEQL